MQPNDKKPKEEAKTKKLEKVVTGTVRKRRTKEVRKFADTFLAGDIKSVKSYIITDVLIPTLKQGVSDIIKNGIDILLYGESKPKSSKPFASKVSYRRCYDNDSRDYRHSYETANHPVKGYGYDDVVIPSRGEAEEVLTRMSEVIETYHTLSVAAMYDLCGVSPEFTDNEYGWTDIRSATIVRVRDGYVIKMPKAMPLD